MTAPSSSQHSAYRSLTRVSFWDGATFSLMVGLGETYLPAYVLALGLGEAASGLITTVPLLLGAALQLSSPFFVSRLKSFRTWVVICAALQAVSFLPLIHVALTGQSGMLLSFLAASLYWAAGMGAGPAWNAWMAAMIPQAQRTKFWSERTWLAHGGAFVGFLVGGYVLHSVEPEMTGFLLLFASALGFRAASAFWLAQHPEPRFHANETFETSSITSAIRYIFRKQGGAEFVRFMFFFHLAVHLAAPFFNAFMLVELQLSYLEYVVLISGSLGAKVFCMPTITRWVPRFGAKALIWISGLGIGILPAMWLVSSNFWYLLALQLFAGAVWAGLELAFPLLVLETTPSRERMGVLSVYNLGRSLSMVVGSLIGAAMLQRYGAGPSAYVVIFLVSTVLRSASLLVITRLDLVPSRVRIFWRTTAIRPSIGSLNPPVIEEPYEEKKRTAAKSSRPSKRAS